MISGTVEVLIRRRPQEVFRFQADPRSELVWNADAIAVERAGHGPTREGSKFRGRYKGAGEFDITITEHQPGLKVASTGKAARLEYDLVDVLEPAEGGTLLKRSMEGRFKGWLRIVEPVLGVVFKKRFAQSAEAIRAALESGQAAAAVAKWD